MRLLVRFSACLGSILALAAVSFATEDAPSSIPKPIPGDRFDLKPTLESLKKRKPRLPAPTPDAPELKGVPFRVGNGGFRAFYLPKSWYSADFQADPAMTLDNVLKVQAFWIVSRANNCHYCLGHQEHKLHAAGQSDDDIAGLDADWSRYSPATHAVLEYARRLTLEPFVPSAIDVEILRPHFNDSQIVELVHTIAMYNSVNRWTDSLGIPQDARFRDTPLSLDTPTSEAWRGKASIVCVGVPDRGSPPTADEIGRQLAAAKTRTAKVQLPGDDEVRAVLSGHLEGDAVPRWKAALARFPGLCAKQISAYNGVMSGGDLPASVVRRIAFTVALENRAWYALNVAEARLAAAGEPVTGHQLADVDAKTAAALALARKLTATPQWITDADIAAVRQHFNDRQTAQIVFATGFENWFDRLTEALTLPLD
jgi:AhpD family alkylhydroperoxidase